MGMENRYDKYKDSGIAWIGEIPEHWSLALVKSIFNRRIKKNNPILTEERLSLSIEKGVTLYLEKTTNLDRFKEDFTQYQIAYPNDIVLNSMNMIVGAIGVSHYLGCVSPVYYVITPKDKNINVNYYGYLLNNFRIRNLYHALGEGIYAIDRGEGRINTCRLKVSYDKFGSIIVPIPSINEQQSIATYLDQKCGEIDELITLQEEMITKLQSYKQSVITEAVTKGLDKNVPLKDSGIEWIGEIPEHWSKNKIIRLFSIIGSGTTPKSSKEDNYIGSVNWIQSGDINGSYIENCKNSISNTALKEYPTLKIYKAPFIIVAMYGASVGNISISNIDGCVNQACCVMNETKQNFKYLFYAMNSVKKYLIYKAEGGGQPNISQDKIKNTWLPIPPFSEQQSIADYLDQKCSEIDELISIKQQKIEKLKDYKKSLIFECVTGKRKVS